jgi:hypothetical protein
MRCVSVWNFFSLQKGQLVNQISAIIEGEGLWTRTEVAVLWMASSTYTPNHEVWQNLSPIKVVIIVACGIQGVFVCHHVLQGQTVSAQYYSSFLHYHPCFAVWEKHPELVENSIILHDNASGIEEGGGGVLGIVKSLSPFFQPQSMWLPSDFQTDTAVAWEVISKPIGHFNNSSE